MADRTNECSGHSGVVSCVAGVKNEIDNKIWPAIREIASSIVPRWAFILLGGIVIVFGLMLINGNSAAIEKNAVKLECLQSIAADVSEIKKVVVK